MPIAIFVFLLSCAPTAVNLVSENGTLSTHVDNKIRAGSLSLVELYRSSYAGMFRRSRYYYRPGKSVSTVATIRARSAILINAIVVGIRLLLSLYILEVLTCSPVILTSRICLIVADLVALGVTWHATRRAAQTARSAGQKTMQTFSGTLMRDGTSVERICEIRADSESQRTADRNNILRVSSTVSLTADTFSLQHLGHLAFL